MGVIDQTKELIKLVANTERIIKDIDRLNDMIRDHADRLVKLEASSELTVEKARGAAMEKIIDVNERLAEKLAAIDHRLADLERSRLPVPSFPAAADVPRLGAGEHANG